MLHAQLPWYMARHLCVVFDALAHERAPRRHGRILKHVVDRAAALSFGFFGLITGTALMPGPLPRLTAG
jgi:hypothetical protein